MKDTLINRIFHAKKLKAWKESEARKQMLKEAYPVFLEKLETATSLQELIDIHKLIWNHGFQNENLSPCPWGYIRSKTIDSLDMDSLYLGGHWGLFTKPAGFWESRRNEPYGPNGFGINEEFPLYELILDQYRRYLKANLKEIYNNL